MNPYNPAATCPKCGHDAIGATYYEARPTWASSIAYGSRFTPDEHLERRCARCGYTWAEAPIDSHQPAGVTRKETNGE